MRYRCLAGCLIGLLGVFCVNAALVVDFEDLGLPPDSFWSPLEDEGASGGFSSGGAWFESGYDYDEHYEMEFWWGFAYSSVNDPTTPGWGNQFAVASGTGVGGAGTYAIAYCDNWNAGGIARLEWSAPVDVTGFYVNNTTYAYYHMLEGDGHTSDPFSAENEDWFTLTIEGRRGSQSAGTVVFHLADFTDPDPDEHYILADWAWIDLTALSEGLTSLEFSLASSNTGAHGINTPTYFAMDNLTYIPEPGAALVFLVGLGGLLPVRRALRRRRGC